MEIKINSLLDADVCGKKVLFRPDINSPIDPVTKKIVNENRIKKTLPTFEYLRDNKARTAIIAHQGDTLDYQNLISMREHAEILQKYLNCKVKYIDDVCGDKAIEEINNLPEGEFLFLGNLRYLTEEVSTFEKDVKLKAEEMLDTYLIRRLAPLFDIYVNDAFSAAHRNCPSMVAFEELLPSFAGPLFFNEYKALTKVKNGAEKPAVFVLGGAKISDAFSMMSEVLKNGTADKILTLGVTGVIMLLASDIKIGESYEKWLHDHDLLTFVSDAKVLLNNFKEKIEFPSDLAFEKDGVRKETYISSLPIAEAMFLDIGADTVERYKSILEKAGTIFVNGPAGVYENELFSFGTKEIWKAFETAKGYTVIGGGDSVSAANKFIKLENINYVCTAGGAMVRFLSGKKLPLLEAMEKAFRKAKKEG